MIYLLPVMQRAVQISNTTKVILKCLLFILTLTLIVINYETVRVTQICKFRVIFKDLFPRFESCYKYNIIFPFFYDLNRKIKLGIYSSLCTQSFRPAMEYSNLKINRWLSQNRFCFLNGRQIDFITDYFYRCILTNNILRINIVYFLRTEYPYIFNSQQTKCRKKFFHVLI